MDGVLLWPIGGASTTFSDVQRLREAGCAVVYVDRYPDADICDFVGVDNRRAARTAVEYLLRLGHTRIGHLTNTDPVRPVADRAEGYRDALRRAEIPFDPDLIATVPAEDHLHTLPAVEQFRSLPKPPTAVFAMNDSLAHCFIVEAQRLDWRVPGDASVIGFDDMERFSPRPALLTTMHQPFEEIGQAATELLLRRIAERDAGNAAAIATGQHHLLPVPLIERGTCQRRT